MFNTLWLTSRDHVKTHRELTSSNTDFDNIIDDQIREVSKEFVTALGRIPLPYYWTQAYDALGQHVTPRHLDVKDLLAITTLTNGDSSVIASGSYVLESAGLYPYWRVRLKSSSGVSFTYSNDWEQAISIAGWFGYVPHYAQDCFVDSGQNGTLAAASTTTLNVTTGTAFEVGQYIRLESELLLITAINSNALTVVRAQLGTTGAAHTDVDIEFVNIAWDIRKAVREVVVYKILAKDQIGGRTRIFDATGNVISQDMDPAVQTAIDTHRYGKVRIGTP